MKPELRVELDKLQEEARKECVCESPELALHSFDHEFSQVACVCGCGVLHEFPVIEQREDGRFVLEEVDWADLTVGDLASCEKGVELEVDGDKKTVRKIKVVVVK